MSNFTNSAFSLRIRTILSAASAAALVLALCGTPQTASAGNECLLDTNNNGTADAGDTDGGATTTNATDTACGPNADASGGDSTAVGEGSDADGSDSTAIGHDANALADQSTAIGSDSDVNATSAGGTAVGQDANVATGSANGIAIGNESDVLADSPGAIAIGGDTDGDQDGAQTAAAHSIAIGSEARTAVGADGGVALGGDVDGDGIGASVTASNSVAIGADSLADEANTVSVGRAGDERRITNVAAGSSDTDAVNVRQLNNLRSDFKNDRDDLRRGIAAAVALATLTPSGPGKTVFNVGWGYYRSENAVGVTVNHRLKIWEDKKILDGTLLMLNAGVSYGIHDEGPVARAGAAFEF